MKRKNVVILAVTALAAAHPASRALAEGWVADPATGCELWSADAPQPDEVVSWSGDCLDGKASGRGIGTWTDADGLVARLDGTMRAGKAHGLADLTLREENGAYLRYLGLFEDGLPSGEATVVNSAGYRLRGEVLDGMSHLRGTIIAPDGSMVRGEFRDEEVVGPAFAYIDRDGETYFGEVLDGLRHGHGVLMMPNEDLYIGEFEAGEAAGYGTFFADSGEFVGVFADSAPNGPGSFVGADGRTLQGRFVDGKPDGIVLVTEADGTQSTETWADGEKVE